MANKKKQDKKLEARVKQLEKTLAERDATIKALSTDLESLRAEFTALETGKNQQMWSRLFKPVGVQEPPDRARLLYTRYREDGYDKKAARDAVNRNLIEEFPEEFAKIPSRKNGVVAFYDDDYLRRKILVDLD